MSYKTKRYNTMMYKTMRGRQFWNLASFLY